MNDHRSHEFRIWNRNITFIKLRCTYSVEGPVWLLLSKLENWMTLCRQRSLLSGLLESYPSFWDEASAWEHVCHS